MIEIPVQTVRNILGDYARGFTDAAIGGEHLVATVEDELASACPTWELITDPADLQRLETAVAYLTAARLLSNIGGVKSMTLGDQAIAYNTAFIASEQARWRRDALSLIGKVCPLPRRHSTLMSHFGVARGRRG